MYDNYWQFIAAFYPCFELHGIEQVKIPDGVRELCNACLRLHRVKFTCSSSLARI